MECVCEGDYSSKVVGASGVVEHVNRITGGCGEKCDSKAEYNGLLKGIIACQIKLFRHHYFYQLV